MITKTRAMRSQFESSHFLFQGSFALLQSLISAEEATNRKLTRFSFVFASLSVFVFICICIYICVLLINREGAAACRTHFGENQQLIMAASTRLTRVDLFYLVKIIR